MNQIVKKLFFLCLILIAGVMSACSDDNESTGMSPYKGDLKLASTEQIFSNTGGTAKVSVQSAAAVTVASSDATWCQVEAGDRSTTMGVTPLTITVSPNTTYDERTAVITVSSAGQQAAITVKQTGNDGLLLDKTSYEVGAAGGTVAVTLKATGDFTTTIGEGWVTTAGTRAMTSYTRNFTVAANSGVARSTKITFTLGNISEAVTIQQAAGESKTAAQLAALMYPGWNLGNTLEGGDSKNNWTNVGINTETSWQSTKTTKEIIDFVAAQGFKSVRIPVSWVMGHITDASNCTIDEAWMNRVQEVVDYCIANGLYVIINDHWDGGWIEVNGFSESSTAYQAVSETTITDKISQLKKIWTQIAQHFANYDQHLLFAGLNEPFQDYALFNGRAEALTPILERYNQAFVDAVRATGGNNASRVLVVQGPATNIASTNSYFDLPTDTQSGRLMVEVHFYDPWDFTGGNTTLYWGAGNHSATSTKNATWGEEDYVKSQMKLMYTKFASKGVPVVLGEYGANWQDGSDALHIASITAWYKTVTTEAINNGIVPFAWDINAPSWPSMTIINRATKTIWNTPAMTGIQNGVKAASWPAM
jgi:endoglucanase